MKISFSNQSISSVQADALAITITKDNVNTVSELLGKQWQEALANEKFTGKLTDKVSFPSLGTCSAKHLIFVGCGNGDLHGLRRAAGNAGSLARKRTASVAFYTPDVTNEKINPLVTEPAGNYATDLRWTRIRKPLYKNSPLLVLPMKVLSICDLSSSRPRLGRDCKWSSGCRLSRKLGTDSKRTCRREYYRNRLG